jgi:predicted HicB family RNase H-like nuclease
MELIKITTRIPKSLKRKLDAESKKAQLTLEQFITNKLSV